jgi:hypothetical protein
MLSSVITRRKQRPAKSVKLHVKLVLHLRKDRRQKQSANTARRSK